MKKYYLNFMLLLSLIGFCQNTKESPNYLPSYNPPSPSVSALMKFEEVPVENYTGIPNVSIPIFNTISKDNKLKVDLSLKYHPSSVAVDEIAGDVGLGWSLFSGGTVSRTVMGLPDEMLIYSKKMGIYHTNISGSTNNYYNVVDIIENGIQNQNEQNIVDEFFWESNEKNKYDTQHDLWQFNFMGFSGKFYIKKNMSNGTLEINPLENYNLKIINHYSTSNDYPTNVIYNPTSFEIIDTNGYKYVFDEYEETKVIPFSYSELHGNFFSYNFADPETTKKYRSSFHLTKVLDMDNKILVEFKYHNEFNESYITGSGLIQNSPTNFDPITIWSYFWNVASCNTCPEGGESNIKKLEPKTITNSTQYEINVKKVKEIIIDGVSKIYFDFVAGREDFCYFNTEKGCRLTDISIKNWNGQLIKKYQFSYVYNEIYNRKLFLKKVDILDEASVEISNYEFGYENEGNEGSNFIGNVGKDYWGYYNLTPTCDIGSKSKEVTPTFCTTDVLQKIKLPSGGSQIFEYEPNDFSYLGTNPITNFDENINNWEILANFSQINLFSSNGNEQFHSLGYSSSLRIFIFDSTIDNNQTTAGFLKLYKIDHYSLDQTKVLVAYLNSNCPQELILESGFEYVVGFTWDANAELGENPVGNLPTTGHAFVSVSKKSRTVNQKNLLYGGGIRIKRIGYFDANVDKDYYKLHSIYSQFNSPSKEVNFSYKLFDEPTKSSGILVFPKPIYNYYKEVKTCLDCLPYSGNTQLQYDTKTSFNNLMVNKTRGSDVGYKNVSVFESQNGRTDFEYTTCLDYPELQVEYSSTPPFFPIENDDFKRGLLVTQKMFDESGKLLNKLTNNYEVLEYNQKIGLRVFSRTESNFSNSYKFPDFATFTLMKSICSNPANLNYNCNYGSTINPQNLNNPSYPECPCRCYNGESVADIIGAVDMTQKFGWIKLSTKTSEDYFYDVNNNQRVIHNTESFTYNQLNKLVSIKTNSNSTNENVITKYYYPKDSIMNNEPFVNELRNNNIIETPLVTQIFLNDTSNKISEQKTIYASFGNSLILPQTIQTAKGNNPLENRVTFNKYDNYGHPLEVQMENGMVISYLWGYNQSQPIAKIENATNAQIISALGITDLNLVSEANLIAINNLRSNASFANAMITTYTYVPLGGVSTITDPKGDKITYIYDDFNRLKEVRDKNNNILSENEYHYRTQN